MINELIITLLIQNYKCLHVMKIKLLLHGKFNSVSLSPETKIYFDGSRIDKTSDATTPNAETVKKDYRHHP